MKTNFFSMFFKGSIVFPILAVLMFASCKDDDDDMPTPDPIASYQYVVDATDFLKVTFTNFSQHATTYSWNFGDGNTSSEQNPVHNFASPGTYNVVLTASNASGKSAQHTKTVMLMDPNQALAMITGAESKRWYLRREGVALGIGPVPGDNQWWSFGGVTPLGDRPCILDDHFTFHRNGDVDISTNGTIFIDSDGNGGWLGPGSPEGCHLETEPGILTAATGEDLSSFADGGDYTFTFDATAGTITVNGLGFYIGLANKLNDGDNYVPQQTKVYTLVHFGQGTIADSMTLALASASQAWNFNLVSYHNPADLPEIPGAQPRADFQFSKENFTVTFQNLSANSTTYAWDFGHGNSSTEENPVHTYAAEGKYVVTLTASDGMGNSDQVTKTVQISSAQFSGAVLSDADGKTWKLAGVQSFYVGPVAGSGEWWGGITEADLVARACMLDDEFIFTDGGSYQYDSKGAVFAEPYMLGNFDCVNDGDILAPYGPLASGTHAFEVTEATDTDPAKIKVTGEGAFVGFSKAFNGGELNGTNAPVSEITYTVLDYTAAGGVETLRIVVDISAGEVGGAWWTIVLRSE